MSYGKYNRQPTILTPNSPESMFTNYQNFGLLGALANELISNYNARGIKKGTAEAEAALANMGKAPQAPLDSQSKEAMDKNATTDLNKDLGVTPQKDATTQAVEAQRQNLPKLNPNGEETITPSKELAKQYFDMNGQQTPNALTPQALQPQARDLAAEKIDYAVEKYKNSDNPAEDKRTIAENTSQGKALIESVNPASIPDFDIQDASAQIRAQLKKNGRSDYQIDQIMQGLSPALVAKEKEWKAAKADELYNSYVKATSDNDLVGRTELVARMAKFDPIKAAVLSKLVDKEWANSDMREQIDQKAKLLMEKGGLSQDDAYKQALGLGALTSFGKASSRSGYSNNPSSGNPTSTAELSWKDKMAVYKTIQDLKDKNPGDPATWPRLAQEQYAECLARLGRGDGTIPQAGGQSGGRTAADVVSEALNGVNLNDWEASVSPRGALMRAFNQLSKDIGRQKAQETIERVAADAYGVDTDYYNEITNNIGVGNAESRREYKEAKRAKAEKDLNPEAYNGKKDSSGFIEGSIGSKIASSFSDDTPNSKGHTGLLKLLENKFGID